jgi:hypothetical protein
MRGTHQGTFFGVPPTGKTIAVQAMNIYRLSDGQFVEEHGQPDVLGTTVPVPVTTRPFNASSWKHRLNAIQCGVWSFLAMRQIR